MRKSICRPATKIVFLLQILLFLNRSEKSWSIVCRRPKEWHRESASNTAVHSIGPVGAIRIGCEVSNKVDCFLKIDRSKGNFDI